MTRQTKEDPHNGKTRRARWQWLFVPRAVKTGEMTQKGRRKTISARLRRNDCPTGTRES